MLAWIVTGATAIPLIILSIFLLKGKGAFFIAGYNTMSDEERATYDEKALCRSVGWLLLIITALMFLIPLAIHFDLTWLLWVSFVLIMVITIGFAIYANTGNRFRKNTTQEK